MRLDMILKTIYLGHYCQTFRPWTWQLGQKAAKTISPERPPNKSASCIDKTRVWFYKSKTIIFKSSSCKKYSWTYWAQPATTGCKLHRSLFEQKNSLKTALPTLHTPSLYTYFFSLKNYSPFHTMPFYDWFPDISSVNTWIFKAFTPFTPDIPDHTPWGEGCEGLKGPSIHTRNHWFSVVLMHYVKGWTFFSGNKIRIYRIVKWENCTTSFIHHKPWTKAANDHSVSTHATELSQHSSNTACSGFWHAAARIKDKKKMHFF